MNKVINVASLEDLDESSDSYKPQLEMKPNMTRSEVYHKILTGQEPSANQMFKPRLTCYSPLGQAVEKPITKDLFEAYQQFKYEERMKLKWQK
jgi:hypothetical protein